MGVCVSCGSNVADEEMQDENCPSCALDESKEEQSDEGVFEEGEKSEEQI